MTGEITCDNCGAEFQLDPATTDVRKQEAQIAASPRSWNVCDKCQHVPAPAEFTVDQGVVCEQTVEVTTVSVDFCGVSCDECDEDCTLRHELDELNS